MTDHHPEPPQSLWTPQSRRHFLGTVGLAALGATVASACASEPEPQGANPTGAAAPQEVFEEPSSSLSGELKILLWSHFVPSLDEWFDPFAKKWGDQVGVRVTVDHINNTEINPRLAAEIQANSGHDLVQYIATMSQYEPSVIPLNDLTEEANNRWGEQLELCRKSSFNPTTGNFYAFSPAWVPDPGDYRKSLWTEVGLGDGPKSWDDLLRGGTEIKRNKGIQLGIGLSQEIDSNMAGSALMWSYGASVQDENENVTINSPETVAAVEFMTKLFKGAMTDEVFSWNPASNNQGLIAGQLSYILNSISAWRTAQGQDPEVANDIFFTPALEGPSAALAAQHVLYNWIVPKYAANPDAAKEFLLHYTANHAAVTYHSKMYDFPAWPSLVPQLDGWLNSDPFGAQPANKLGFLSKALDWSTNIGHPGPANTAAGEIFNTFVVSNMFARAARGEQSPADSVAEAESECKRVFAKWRSQGLVGGGE
ncbi:MAG: ABC transporter substrate-binding protein [Actinomycetes bacterium]|jgi:multiple sugar transport system substrate-binding protein